MVTSGCPGMVGFFNENLSTLTNALSKEKPRYKRQGPREAALGRSNLEGFVRYLVFALASVFVLSSVFPFASALALVSLPSMLVAIILYLIVTLSPFLISPVDFVSLSRAI